MPLLGQARADLRQWLTQDDRDWWYLGPLVAAFGIGALFDIWLVNTGRPSVTNWVTAECAAHPTLIGFGWLIGLGLARVVRRYWWMVMVVFVITGHLFTGLTVCGG
jgi:hypothetical protein